MSASLLFWALLSATTVGAAERVQVVTSIRPLALIARDLLGDSAEIDVLVEGSASPHHYSLRVSDMEALGRADLLLWLGPELERFLASASSRLPEQRVLTIAEQLPLAQEADDHHGGDLHLWLDPVAAFDIARALAERLAALNPDRQETLSRRLQGLQTDYAAAAEAARQRLAPVRERGFVVRHRGYDHLVEAFDLKQLGWISAGSDQPPGVRHLYELQNRLEGEDVRCLFVEASHESETARNLARELGLKLVPLDILGLSAQSYPELLRRLSSTLADCLAGR